MSSAQITGWKSYPRQAMIQQGLHELFLAQCRTKCLKHKSGGGQVLE
jgi:hypothetical protein